MKVHVKCIIQHLLEDHSTIVNVAQFNMIYINLKLQSSFFFVVMSHVFSQVNSLLPMPRATIDKAKNSIFNM